MGITASIIENQSQFDNKWLDIDVLAQSRRKEAMGTQCIDELECYRLHFNGGEKSQKVAGGG